MKPFTWNSSHKPSISKQKKIDCYQNKSSYHKELTLDTALTIIFDHILGSIDGADISRRCAQKSNIPVFPEIDGCCRVVCSYLLHTPFSSTTTTTTTRTITMSPPFFCVLTYCIALTILSPSCRPARCKDSAREYPFGILGQLCALHT